MNRLFGSDLVRSSLNNLKIKASETYFDTKRKIFERIINGTLIHADETSANIKGHLAYVWVFTSLREVVYILAESREGELVKELLKGFNGVLVSDFYAAYDTIECAQQKCLIHLMRDLNDEILNNPFDEEAKTIALRFAALLKPIVDTIDLRGLKKHFLRRHLDDRFHETDHGTGNLLADSSFVVDRTRSGIMAGWRQAVALAMTGEEIEALTALSRSRTEPAGRVSRAAMLLGYREKPSFFAVGRRLGVHHQTVQRCVERAMAYGALAALDDRPRPGKEPTITPEAKAWLVSLACDKAKEHGYPHELWTTRLLARHARERGPAAGHQCLARLAQGTVCKLLGQEEIKPHKVRYYLERRDAEFEPKMAEVLCVYREVQVLKKAAAKAEKSKKPVAIVSYDEKPGIQAIATTAPDLPPVPGRHASFARDHEYKRHGTLSLLAGIDLLTGKVHALVRERHRSREFIEFLKLLDAAYPASTAIKLILDYHSAHISRETRAWLDTRPPGRFDFTFTPKHGSWLNLIEGFFSTFARSVLRHIRVTSKHELKQRIMAGIDDVNRHPVIHTWSYKLAEAA